MKDRVRRERPLPPPRNGGEPVRANRGLGDLGEHMGDPRRYVSEPGYREGVEPAKSRDLPGKPRSRSMPADIQASAPQAVETVRNVPPTASAVVITPRTIDNLKSHRLDTGIKDRLDIAFLNVSNDVVWVGTNPMAAAGLGWPLAAEATAGGYNGGSLSVNANEKVSWWGRAATGAAKLIIVIETARD